MADNIFKNIPADLPYEIFDSLLESDSVKIERIVSKGHLSPQDFWYDQNQNEWVILLKGKARLKFKNNRTVELKEGDYLNIPAHQKHRVKWTDPDCETIWLAVFY